MTRSAENRASRSIPRRLLRVTTRAAVVFALFNLGLLVVTETQWFRSIARDFLIQTVDSTLTARLELGEISGNIFSGWEIRDVRLVTAAGPLISARSVVIRYSLFTIPWKKIDVSEVTLNEPVIMLTRGSGGEWNFANLSRDTTESEGGEFDWRVIARMVRIVDGRFVLRDSTDANPVVQTRFSSSQLQLDGITLALSADIGPERKSVSINRLSFRNSLGDVALHNLSGDIRLGRKFTEVRNLSVQTSRSALLLSVRLDSLSVAHGFTYEKFIGSPVRLELTAPSIDVRDLQYFLPALDFLGGTPSVELTASGSMERLEIEDLSVSTSLSRVSFTGQLGNIHTGADLSIRVASTSTRIDAADLPITIPGIPLPDYSEVGVLVCRSLRFDGTPLDFTAEIDAQTDAGEVAATASLDLRGASMKYDATVSSRGLDLARVFRAPRLSSSLTVSSTIRGVGFTPGSMSARVDLRIDSSRYQRYTARSLLATLDVRPDSLIASVRGDFVQSSISLDGALSFVGDSVNGFRVTGRAGSLDLGRILGDDSLATDLDMSFVAAGDGIDPAASSGTATVMFEPSRFNRIPIDHDTLQLQLDQRDRSARRLDIRTRYADIELQGRFDLPRISELAAATIDSAAGGFRGFLLAAEAPDSMDAPVGTRAQRSRRLRASTATAVPPRPSRDTSAFMDARYAVRVRHPERLSRFFTDATLFVRGEYSGSIRGGWNGLSLDGTVDMSDLYFVGIERSFGSAGLRCTYSISDLSPERLYERLRFSLDARVGDVSWDDVRASNIGIRVGYSDRTPRLTVRGTLLDDIQLDVDARAQQQPGSYIVSFSRLAFAYRDFRWQAETPARATVDTGGVTIDAWRFQRESSLIVVSGSRTFSGQNDISVKVTDVRIADVEQLLSGASVAPNAQVQGFGGMADIECTVGGTDAAPVLAVDAFVEDLAYQNARFGDLTFEATYGGTRLELYSELEYPVTATETRKVFFASGSVPVSIAFDGMERDPVGEANLRVQMRQLPLALLERFIGLFSPLDGVANADLSLSGRIADARFGGWLEVDRARGRFLFNNMTYDLGLRLEPEGSVIHVRNFSVRNDASEREPGVITARGTIQTSRYTLGEIDLAIDGRLKVLRKASRSVLKTLYGDLYVATGAKGLRYTGRLERSNLAGDLRILEGDLVFPAEAQGGSGAVANIIYVDVDDVSTQRVTSLSAARDRARSSVFGERSGNGYDTVRAVRETSILDAMNYEIDVATDGSLVISMPFSALSQQELNARLEIRDFKAERRGGAQTFAGVVHLGSGSRYLFLGKPFRATGSLTFLRDLQNPDLDLKAVYSDYHLPPSGSGEERRKVYVILTITGTRTEPRLAWDIRFDSENGTQRPRGGALDSDALSFILFGLFSDELSASDKGKSRVIDQTDAITNALGSAILSSTMTDLLSKAGFQDVLKRVEVDRLGSQDARLKLTGEIGQAILTYDGKINNLGSSEIMIEIPLGMLFPSFGIGNMVVQFSKRTANGALDGASSNQEANVYEGKILYRFSL